MPKDSQLFVNKLDRPRYFTKAPNVNELKEYVPAICTIGGNLYSVIRINNKLYYNKYESFINANSEDSTVKDFYTELSLGNIPNKSHVNKFGRNEDVDTTEETIWNLANAASGAVTRWTPQTSGEALEIVSNSTSDDVGGTGATGVRVFYLDGNKDYGYEDVVMNGTTAVQLAETNVLQVYRMYVNGTGSNHANVGEIACQVTAGGAKRAIIAAEDGQTEMAVFPVARNYKALMTGCSLGIDDNTAGALGIIWEYHDIGTSNYYKRRRHNIVVDVDSQVHVQHKFEPYKVFDSETIIEFTAIGTAINALVTGQFDLILVKVA